MEIKIDVRGLSKSFSIEDEIGDAVYGDQLFSVENDPVTFEIGGKKYSTDDFANSDADEERLDIDPLIEEYNGERVTLLTAYASTSFMIEMTEGAEFDPKKATKVICNWMLEGALEEAMLKGIIYDGKFYELTVDDWLGGDEEVIWPISDDDEDWEDED